MAVVEVRNLHKMFDGGQQARHRRDQPGDRGGRIPRPPRPVRLRQDDASAHHRRARAADRGRGAHRRRGRQRAAAPRPADRDGVPELCPLPAQDGVRQHRLPAAGAKIEKAERERKARWAAELLGIDPAARPQAPRSSPAASASASRWPARWCATPTCSCSTSRCPTSTPSCAASARDELKRFQAEVGTTTIYVTHDQTEAMGLGDRIVVLKDGAVRQVGPPAEVYDHPADTFVATFIGSPPMNLVPRGRPARRVPPRAPAAGRGRAAASRVTVPFTVDRLEYLSGDRHVYGTVTGIGERDPRHRPAASDGHHPDRTPARRTSSPSPRATCASSTPPAG